MGGVASPPERQVGQFLATQLHAPIPFHLDIFIYSNTCPNILGAHMTGALCRVTRQGDPRNAVAVPAVRSGRSDHQTPVPTRESQLTADAQPSRIPCRRAPGGEDGRGQDR